MLAWEGLGLTTGQAIKLCSGTTDTAKTITCFVKAYAADEDNGLGLTMENLVAKQYKLHHFTFYILLDK